MSVELANAIYISDTAKKKIHQLMKDAGVENDASYFVRVGVVGGGCSGLSYKLDFDNEAKPMDQVFEDNGIKVVTDLKSFLYLVNTTLDFSDGLNGKGFYFSNPNASR
ncbi:MAG: iron-sulfur cluster assembly accessory protein, partial [Chitinophagaceae bacterium]